jgi:hypothetical protein
MNKFIVMDTVLYICRQFSNEILELFANRKKLSERKCEFMCNQIKDRSRKFEEDIKIYEDRIAVLKSKIKANRKDKTASRLPYKRIKRNQQQINTIHDLILRLDDIACKLEITSGLNDITFFTEMSNKHLKDSLPTVDKVEEVMEEAQQQYDKITEIFDSLKTFDPNLVDENEEDGEFEAFMNQIVEEDKQMDEPSRQYTYVPTTQIGSYTQNVDHPAPMIISQEQDLSIRIPTHQFVSKTREYRSPGYPLVKVPVK